MLIYCNYSIIYDVYSIIYIILAVLTREVHARKNEIIIKCIKRCISVLVVSSEAKQ